MHRNPAGGAEIVPISPYLCRRPRRFDLMVGPYRTRAKALLRSWQIRGFDRSPGRLRILKVPSGYWVVRERER